MKSLSLYCKSYSTDLNRVVRLAKSIHQHNTDKLPFYVSVPKAEIPLFSEHLMGLGVELLSDEEILKASPRINLERVQLLPGHLSQQIVKSEFWRLNLSQAYLCLDSDSIFIRKFDSNDFLYSSDIPYTVINEAQEFLLMSLTHGKTHVVENFHREAERVQTLFNRNGKAYSFGPMPMVWHRLVWESLDAEYLRPRGMSFLDAIHEAPLESRWYGEAALKFGAIPIVPSEPLFKVYHYAWQFDQDRRNGIGNEELTRLYSGVIYQSAWERNMDWPTEGGGKLSHVARRLRRMLGRI